MGAQLGQPGGEVGGTAAQLDHVEPGDGAEQIEVALGDAEQSQVSSSAAQARSAYSSVNWAFTVVHRHGYGRWRPRRPATRLAPAQLARVLAFWAANSSSVRIPRSFSSARSLSCWMGSAAGGAGGAGSGCS